MCYNADKNINRNIVTIILSMVLVVVTVNILRILGSKGRDGNIYKIIYNNRLSK